MNTKATILAGAAVLGLASASTFAQGTINFQNSSSSLVSTNSGTQSGTAAVTGTSGIKVQLFYIPVSASSTAPTAVSTADFLAGNLTENGLTWTALGTPGSISPVAGKFGSYGETTGSTVAPAGNVWLMALAWNGNGASYTAASQVATYFGATAVWSQGTGDGGSVPAVYTYAGGEGPLVLTPVPEPSTIALAGLGAASLLLFRRRK